MSIIKTAFTSRAYTTKSIAQVRAASGSGHHATASMMLPGGRYNVFLHGMLSITEAYSAASISEVDFYVGLNVSNDNPTYSTSIANRNWQQSFNLLKKANHYQCLGGTLLDLTNATSTVEARVGIRDTSSPMNAGEGFDDSTILVFQLAVSVVKVYME